MRDDGHAGVLLSRIRAPVEKLKRASKMPDPHLLFVYGTLRPGHAPAPLAPYVDRCKCVGPGSMPGRLYDLGSYPGAVLDPAGGQLVHGQVLDVPDEATLRRLDAYEGYDPADSSSSLFVRTRCDVTLGGGRTVAAWVYVYNRDVSRARPVPGGRYDPSPP